MSLRNAVTLGSTTHSYSGGGTGANGIDGDFTTSQNVESSGGEGGATLTLVSTHTFASAKNITQIKFRLYAYASATAHYAYTASYSMYVQYCIGGVWTDVAGSNFSSSASGDNGGEGPSTGTVEKDTGAVTVTYSAALASVTAVKAYVYSNTNASGGEGVHSEKAHIYEVEAFYVVDTSYAGAI